MEKAIYLFGKKDHSYVTEGVVRRGEVQNGSKIAWRSLKGDAFKGAIYDSPLNRAHL